MPVKNGKTIAVRDWVAQNPGRTASEIAAAIGIPTSSGTVAYATKLGLIFASGPRNWHRYYATAVLAAAAHDGICAHAKATRDLKKKDTWRRGQIKRRGKYHAAGHEPLNTRHNGLQLPIGATISPRVKVTIAPSPKGRFEPDVGFERVITSDWFVRRQAEGKRETA